MNTKKYICDALLELMKEKHFDKITVRDIVTQAQIARSTFYVHFENKFDVISWYCHDHAAKLLQKASNKNWYELSLQLTRFSEKNKFFFKCMYQKDSSQSYTSYEEAYMYTFLKKEYLNHHNKKSLSTSDHLMILFAVKGHLNILREWIVKDLPLNHTEISDLSYRLLPNEIRECL